MRIEFATRYNDLISHYSPPKRLYKNDSELMIGISELIDINGILLLLSWLELPSHYLLDLIEFNIIYMS